MGKPAIAYTTEQMIEILKMYQANGNNLMKTSKESGVSRPTLRRWIEQMGPDVFNHNHVQEIVFKVDEKLADKKAAFDSLVMDAKLLAIKRITARIPKTKDLDQLTRGIKILNELDGDVKKLGVKGNGDDEDTRDYIQIVTNALNIYTNGNKTN